MLYRYWLNLLLIATVLIASSESIVLSGIGLASGALTMGTALGALGGAALLKLGTVKLGLLGLRQTRGRLSDTGSQPGLVFNQLLSGLPTGVRSMLNRLNGILPQSTRYGRRLGEALNDDFLQDEEDVDVESLESYFELVSALDGSQCARKLICELKAKSPSDLQPDEEQIVSIFNDDVGLGASESTSSLNLFRMAAYAGVVGGFETCHALYGQYCYTSGEDIMSNLRELDF